MLNHANLSVSHHSSTEDELQDDSPDDDHETYTDLEVNIDSVSEEITTEMKTKSLFLLKAQEVLKVSHASLIGLIEDIVLWLINQIPSGEVLQGVFRITS